LLDSLKLSLFVLWQTKKTLYFVLIISKDKKIELKKIIKTLTYQENINN